VLEAVCSLQSRVLGPELVFTGNTLLLRPQVYRSPGEILGLFETWCGPLIGVEQRES